MLLQAVIFFSMTPIEQGMVWMAFIAFISIVAAIGIQRNKVRARKRARDIDAAMQRHPAGNQR